MPGTVPNTFHEGDDLFITIILQSRGCHSLSFDKCGNRIDEMESLVKASWFLSDHALAPHPNPPVQEGPFHFTWDVHLLPPEGHRRAGGSFLPQLFLKHVAFKIINTPKWHIWG